MTNEPRIEDLLREVIHQLRLTNLLLCEQLGPAPHPDFRRIKQDLHTDRYDRLWRDV